MHRQRWEKWGLIAMGWTLIGLFFSSQMYLFSTLGYGMPTTWGRAIGSGLADWYIWGSLVPLVFWFSRRFRLGRETWPAILLMHGTTSVILALVQLVMTTALAQFIATNGGRPFPFLDGLRFAVAVKFHWNVVIYWTILSLSHAMAYYREYRERDLHAAHLQAQLAQAQLQSLKTQLHPHFLFNTLNGISELIYDEPESADRMISHLSELLRMSLDTGSDDEVPLRQEQEFLIRYLEIQKTRFGERLTALIDIDHSVRDALVPNLILQPLAENAIRHGIGPRASPGQIEVHAWPQDQTLRVQIIDNGTGLPRSGESAVREGVGLGNTRERLRQLYGAAQSLDLSDAAGGGLVVTLVMPLRTRPGGPAPLATEENDEDTSVDRRRRATSMPETPPATHQCE